MLAGVLLVRGGTAGLARAFPDRLAAPALIPLALVASTALSRVVSLRAGVVIACGALLLWANRSRLRHRAQAVALGCAVLGVTLNALASLVRGGMPVVVSSAEAAGVSTDVDPGAGYVWVDRPTPFDWLTGDSVPLPGLHTVFSGGDVLLLVGFPLLLTWFLVGVLRPAAPTSPTHAPERRYT